MKKIKINHFRKMKEKHEKIVMLTCFDAPSAAMAAEAGVEALLVGDSLAMTILGYHNTLPLTMEESLHHVKAARRGAPEGFIIGDMPFMSWQSCERTALENAGRFLQQADADAVKLEGGAEIAPLVGRMVGAGIPVVGHIGILPQKVLTSGGYFVPGRTGEDAERLKNDARALAAAGAFMIVLECIPAALAAEISKELTIPTIGIGSGAGCDGQVQVFYDIMGMGGDGFLPKHAKRFANLHEVAAGALASYVGEVKSGVFPGPENSF